MTHLPGLGPKRARRLFDELEIDSLEALRTAAQEQRIRTLKGFGPKAEESILAALDAHRPDEPRTRVVLNRALAVGEPLVAALREHPAAERVELAGLGAADDRQRQGPRRDRHRHRPGGARARGGRARPGRVGRHRERGRGAAAHPHRAARRPADRRARPVRQPAPAPDRLQAAQHGAARRGRAQGPARLRVRGARRRHRRDPPLRRRGGGVRAARARVHRARAAREPRRARGGGRLARCPS